MEVSKKRKRDVDCPRITYDATTKVFDRLFKEESLEEMKNVVRKKLGLSLSLPVHLSQLRDGKSVVLEDDDDFDAFYASVHSSAMARIKVYLGDDLLSTAGPDAGFASEPIQLPTVHHATAGDHGPSKKRKVSFVEPAPQPAPDNVKEPDSSQSLPTFEAVPEAPTIMDISSADAGQAHEMADNTKKKKRRKLKGNKMKGQTVVSTLEDQSLGEQVQSEIAAAEASGSNSKKSAKMTKGHVHASENTPYNAVKSKKRPRTSTTENSKVLDEAVPSRMDDAEGSFSSSKKSKHRRKYSDPDSGATNPIDNNQADSKTKGPEDSQHHTPSIGQAHLSEAVSTQPSKETKKSQKEKEVVIVDEGSNGVLSAPISATSNSTIVAKRAKRQDPKPPASTSVLGSNSKGKTRNKGPSRSLKTPTKQTLNEDDTDTQWEQKTKSSASAEGKIKTKNSRKNVEPANSAQDQALNSDLTAATMAAVAAILARKSLSSEGNRPTATPSSPLADATALSPSMAPITSSSSLDNQPIPPDNISTSAEHPNTAPKCPICDKTPSHVRSRCPIIRAGIRSMRQRIAELQQGTPQGNDEEREKVIEELRRIIDKRTKRNQTTIAENKSTNDRSMADKSVVLPPLAVDSSPVLESQKTSQAVKSVKVPSQKMKSMHWPRLAESLSSGDISSYTEQDLASLIRGPNVTLADLPSSDSGEDEEALEEESEEVEFKSSRSQGRIRYSSSEEEEEEEEVEASPFAPSIIPLPIRPVSELSSGDESSRSEDLPGDTSFHEVNNLGSSIEVDKTGDAAVNDAYAVDFTHLNALDLPENGGKAVGDILNALDEHQFPDESEPKTASDAARPPVTIATPQPTPQSDPIEASEQPEASSPQSPIVSIEEDLPLQSTPKAEVAGRTKSQRISSILARKTTDLNSKPRNVVSGTGVNGINGNRNSPRSTKRTGSLTRITDLPIPVNPAIRIIKPVGVQTRRQAARAEEEEANEQGRTDASQAKQKNGQLSSSQTSPNTTNPPAQIPKTPSKSPAKTPSKTLAKTPAKGPVPSNEANDLKTQSVTMVQDVLGTIEPAPSNAEQSLASWAVLERNSLVESETPGKVDELRYSPDMPDFPTPAQLPASPAVVNGVSKESDPLFLHSESQQSFPYSQYPNFHQELQGSEDEEEDEVQASVIKRQTTIKSSSKFRSLTEIASRPTLFTPPMRFTQTDGAKEEVKNLYGRTSKGEEESEDSDAESGSDEEIKAQVSHIPLSRRAGTLLSERG